MKRWKAAAHPANASKAKAPLRSPRGYATATPTAHVSTPPSDAIRWVGTHGGRQEVTEAVSWFAARERLARQFGCGLGQVEVKRA